MIKTILFDWGGTCAAGSVSAFVKNACKILGVPFEPFKTSDVLFDSEYNKGKLTIQEFFSRYFPVSISEKQMEQLIETWKSTWNPEPAVMQLVKQLKKNYVLGVFSNSDSVNFQMGFEKGWYADFSVLVLSHEFGIAKPDKEIYEYAIQKTGCKAEKILFIDDQEACLKTAREMGMHTILFRSAEQLKKDLKKMEIQF